MLSSKWKNLQMQSNCRWLLRTHSMLDYAVQILDADKKCLPYLHRRWCKMQNIAFFAKVLTWTSSSWKCFCMLSIIWSAWEHNFVQNSAEVELASALWILSIRHLSLSNWIFSSACSWAKESSASTAGNITLSSAMLQTERQEKLISLNASSHKIRERHVILHAPFSWLIIIAF